MIEASNDSVASFKCRQSLSATVCSAFLSCQIEKTVDELNLPKKIPSCYPSNLPFRIMWTAS